jgi:hypothetical protein
MRAKLKILLLFTLLLGPSIARAQFAGYFSPQTVQQKVFNAVSTPIVSPATGVFPCTPAPAAACPISNIGQNFHILTFTDTVSTDTFSLRLEGSQDGITFFPISDDALGGLNGSVYGQGYYPVIRANLLFYVGSGTLTVYYAGTSTGSIPPTGQLNQSQTYRKIVAFRNGLAQGYTLAPPCGSTSGELLFNPNGSVDTGASIAVLAGSDISTLTTVAGAGAYTVVGSTLNAFQVPAQEASYITVTISSLPFSGFSLYYQFNCGTSGTNIAAVQVAGLQQPPATFNSESTSAANSSVTVTIPSTTGFRVNLYSVSARCSAGSASLLVRDGGTQIWSTAGTEVSTTTFRFGWSPGLAGSLNNVMTITLTTCGAANTGTLDVQASQN